MMSALTGSSNVGVCSAHMAASERPYGLSILAADEMDATEVPKE